ncbi:VOC family protein [Paenibacillus soyae]|uniref:VOC family protein n=1 Tax=Paenibacillus soyae TaxID=2969249 RepID=A0A9X2MSJ2_9BACL|nr:VOC family protein [Paenibacillus soyae]MCR2805600.1 VOC family protein [Paenibacillus soyae]
MKLRVGAVFIPVLNLKKSIDWYKECFDLQLIEDWGEGASLSFKSGETLLALIQVQKLVPLEFPVQNNQPHNYYHFETDDFVELRNHLERKGIEIIETHDHGVMNELFIMDPSGNRIAFYCEKKESPFYKHAAGKVSW